MAKISLTANLIGSNLYIDYSQLQLGVDYYIWGAQLNEGSTALPYQKTETRLNIPRLDYSNGTCPSLLVEPQRTNRLIYSEQLIQGKAWAYTSGSFTVTENTTDTLDPFGNNNADKFNATTQSNNDSYTTTSGSGSLTLSIFAKKGQTILFSYTTITYFRVVLLQPHLT